MDKKNLISKKEIPSTQPLCLKKFEVDDVSYGLAKIKMKVTEESKNPFGIMHGGIIFAFLDNCAGYSAATTGKKCVTLNSSINFIRDISDGYLYAIPKLIHEGKTTMVYEVEAFDDKKNLIAKASFTMFTLGKWKEGELNGK